MTPLKKKKKGGGAKDLNELLSKERNSVICNNLDNVKDSTLKSARNRKTNIVCSQSYVRSTKAELIEAESKMVVPRGGRLEAVGEIGKMLSATKFQLDWRSKFMRSIVQQTR